jgi:hypothetical protein
MFGHAEQWGRSCMIPTSELRLSDRPIMSDVEAPSSRTQPPLKPVRVERIAPRVVRAHVDHAPPLNSIRFSDLPNENAQNSRLNQFSFLFLS